MNTLRHIRFHGPNRPQTVEALTAPDIVITTYATLASNHDSRGLLYRMAWYRVVLDEGEFRGPFHSRTSSLSLHQLITYGIPLRSSGKRPGIFRQHGDGAYRVRQSRTRWRILPPLRDFSNFLP